MSTLAAASPVPVRVETNEGLVVEGPHAIAVDHRECCHAREPGSPFCTEGSPMGPLEWVTIAAGDSILVQVHQLRDLIAALTQVLEASRAGTPATPRRGNRAQERADEIRAARRVDAAGCRA